MSLSPELQGVIVGAVLVGVFGFISNWINNSQANKLLNKQFLKSIYDQRVVLYEDINKKLAELFRFKRTDPKNRDEVMKNNYVDSVTRCLSIYLLVPMEIYKELHEIVECVIDINVLNDEEMKSKDLLKKHEHLLGILRSELESLKKSFLK